MTRPGWAAALAALTTVACGTRQWVFDATDLADVGADASASIGNASPDAMIDGAADVGERRCVTDHDCALSSLHCDVASGTCVACVDDDDCTQVGAPRCDSALHLCVQCAISGDCSAGDVCEPTSRTCVPSCADGGVCPSSAPLCSQPRGVCIRCSSDRDCLGSTTGPICSVATGQCVACTSDYPCVAPQPRCDLANNQCVGCLSTADCGREQLCEPYSHTCLHEL